MDEIGLVISKYTVLQDYINKNPEFKDKMKIAYKIFFRTNNINIVKSGALAESSSYNVGEVNMVENMDRELRLAGYGIHACFVSENCNRFYSVENDNTIKYQIVVIGEYLVDEIKLCCRRIFIIPDTNNLAIYNKQMYNFIKKYIKDSNVFIKNVYTNFNKDENVTPLTEKMHGTYFDLHEQIGNANDNLGSVRISIIRKYYKKLPNGEDSALATFEKLDNESEMFICAISLLEQ